ncbi:c-di-GMP-binding flagellar brake protein YcgR, contains PilZNR and PilZ domains [Halanaerobium congolense]|jgi:c-di-GMP-binding flagellar brake protein YcgR|uniref:C-di-GMP-binding flagellar brake protein YcgR n=2 Tax=Halanaerobiaceae TaxID=972 RepID=A0A1G6RIR7_9FIRM|nr:MAG: Flagellar protein [Halanaerobium sp. T82-1]OEG61776.1 MAG: pilus assembly protein PilZ [Halanaerobium sp. MDAL1]PUU92300.1 MAG: Flagellar protein [Halanaerobium sp.]TDP26330.1 c-di-GMP-binding flagellar brake protein YcgR [Halanaerobium congolense]PUU92501.1 MAG: Flagellar protein [Halanaerobium sp.]
MMDKLKVNDKIEVEFKSDKYPDIYLSKVADFVDAGIVITGLYKHGTPLAVKKGDKINVYFTTERAAYEFESVVLQRIKKPIYFILIKEPKELKRIQRRDYFRLELDRIMKVHKEKKDGSVMKKEAHLLDISGGGVQIKAKEEFAEGDIIKLSFGSLLNMSELIKGKIVRKSKDDFETYRYGVEFVDINAGEREKIIQWIFSLQRQLRKKGLGQ